jgi:hypothetical protein
MTLFFIQHNIKGSQANLKWPIYPAQYVRVVLHIANDPFNSESIFSLTNTYLKYLCIINYVSNDILPQAPQKSQMIHVSEEF